MKKRFTQALLTTGVIFSINLLAGCVTKSISPSVYQYYTPKYPLNYKPSRILLLNTYNVAAQKYRSNKEELFIQLIDSILVTCKNELNQRENIDAVIIPGYVCDSTATHNELSTLLHIHTASHAIVIDSFNVDFKQTDVAVEKSASGSKSREAFYDIVSDIHFSFYSGDTLFNQSKMTKSAHHSSRLVVSGLLSAGPNIVAQRKTAWQITRATVEEYLNLFFKSGPR